MITSEHWINQQFSKQIINEDIYTTKQGIKEAMIIFAKEAIKADRINLLEHIHTKCLNTEENSCSECEYHTIDRDSLINAPNIELL